MKSTREAAYETACKALENAGVDVEEAEFLSRKVVDYLGQENLLAQKTEAVSVSEDGFVTFGTDQPTHILPVGKLVSLGTKEAELLLGG